MAIMWYPDAAARARLKKVVITPEMQRRHEELAHEFLHLFNIPHEEPRPCHG